MWVLPVSMTHTHMCTHTCVCFGSKREDRKFVNSGFVNKDSSSSGVSHFKGAFCIISSQFFRRPRIPEVPTLWDPVQQMVCPSLCPSRFSIHRVNELLLQRPEDGTLMKFLRSSASSRWKNLWFFENAAFASSRSLGLRVPLCHRTLLLSWGLVVSLRGLSLVLLFHSLHAAMLTTLYFIVRTLWTERRSISFWH